MGMMDKFLNAMRLNTDDDEEEFLDDLYDEELDEDPYYKEPKKKMFTRKERPVVEKEYDDPEPLEKPEKESRFTQPQRQAPVSNKVTPMRQTKRQQNGSAMAVCVIKPSSVDDSREITETLLLGKTVVLNLEGLDLDIAQRIIDFTSGSCYAIYGNLQKVSNYIFIVTPSSVDISGDFLSLIDSFDSSFRSDI